MRKLVPDHAITRRTQGEWQGEMGEHFGRAHRSPSPAFPIWLPPHIPGREISLWKWPETRSDVHLQLLMAMRGIWGSRPLLRLCLIHVEQLQPFLAMSSIRWMHCSHPNSDTQRNQSLDEGTQVLLLPAIYTFPPPGPLHLSIPTGTISKNISAWQEGKT